MIGMPAGFTSESATTAGIVIAQGLIAASETGMKEHDRSALAWQMMERKLVGRRASSKLPELIELVIARPLVHAGTVAKMPGELRLQEMNGRGRFQAWGVV